MTPINYYNFYINYFDQLKIDFIKKVSTENSKKKSKDFFFSLNLI